MRECWQAEYDAARRAGLPLDPDDFYPEPLPSSLDAAPLLDEAVQMMRRAERQMLTLSTPAEYFSAIDPFLQVVRQAVQRPHCRFGPRWGDRAEDGEDIKLILKDLGIVMVEAAERGDIDFAVANARAYLQILDYLVEHPTLYSALLAWGQEPHFNGHCLTAAASTRSAGHLRELRKVVDQPRRPIRLSHALKTKPYQSADSLRQVRTLRELKLLKKNQESSLMKDRSLPSTGLPIHAKMAELLADYIRVIHPMVEGSLSNEEILKSIAELKGISRISLDYIQHDLASAVQFGAFLGKEEPRRQALSAILEAKAIRCESGSWPRTMTFLPPSFSYFVSGDVCRITCPTGLTVRMELRY